MKPVLGNGSLRPPQRRQGVLHRLRTRLVALLQGDRLHDRRGRGSSIGENGPSYPMLIDLMKHGEKLSHEAGVREYLSLIVKAHAIRLRDRFYGHMSRERNG